MPKMLIDCDAFFASCEQARNPKLRGRKVLVAGDIEHRSVIAAASYEARACGVKAGTPIQEAHRLVPDGIFLIGNPGLYLDYNLKLLKKLHSYKRPVELYSIDEFYLDFDGTYEEAAALAAEFQGWVRREAGITVSIGIAPTKVIAKLAAELKKPDGLTVIRPGEIEDRLADLPVGKLFGVGPRTEAFLQSRGVTTIGALRACHPLLLQAELGVRGKWLHDAAMGVENDLVKVVPDPYKSMGNEMTLPENTSDPRIIRSFLYHLSDLVAQRLRADGSMARTVHLRVRYDDFSQFARSKTMPRPMLLADQLLEGVNLLLQKHHRDPDKKIRLLGVGASNLVRAKGYQLALFPGERRAVALARALDRIHETFGQEAIGRASALAVNTGRTLVPFAVVPGSGRRPT